MKTSQEQPLASRQPKPIRSWFKRLFAPSMERQVQRDLQRIQHPIFAKVSRCLEERIPPTDSFGKFRQSDQPHTGVVHPQATEKS